MPAPAVFKDRAEAGRCLAVRLERLRREAPVVLALPTGGVLVAAEVARALAAPLDVLVVRTLGFPGARLGAVAEGGVAIVHHDRARAEGLGAQDVARLRDTAVEAADGLALRLRAGDGPRNLVGRTALLIDDGVGTGDSAVAAAHTARRRGAARIVLGVPLAGQAVLDRLAGEVDEIVCVKIVAAERWYEEARPGEQDIRAALEASSTRAGVSVPEGARGAIVLVGAPETVRLRLREKGYVTLTLDDGAEAAAVAAAVERLLAGVATAHLPLGALGCGRGAETVLAAAAQGNVLAVVAAGGRPDHASIPHEASTLLIVGGEDRHVLSLARGREARLAVIPGAGHDFAEPGAFEQVAALAADWFARHL